jgi:hypothetical protein
MTRINPYLLLSGPSTTTLEPLSVEVFSIFTVLILIALAEVFDMACNHQREFLSLLSREHGWLFMNNPLGYKIGSQLVEDTLAGLIPLNCKVCQSGDAKTRRRWCWKGVMN